MSTSSAPRDGRAPVRRTQVRRPLRAHRTLALTTISTVLLTALSLGRAGLASRDDRDEGASAGETTDDHQRGPHGPRPNPPRPATARLLPAAAFVRHHTLATGAGPNIVAAADLDRDGDPDLVVTNVCGREAIQVFVNTGSGVFTPQPPVPLAGVVDPGRLAAADLDRDGSLDLVLTGETSGNVAWIRHAGDGRLQPLALRVLESPTPAQAVAGDLDGDGSLEVVVAHLSASDQLSVVQGSAAPWSERAVTRLDAGRGIESIALADLDRDGDLDLVAANRETGIVSCFRNRGRGEFEPATRGQAGRQPGSLAIADLNADGRGDLVAVNEGSNDVSVFLATGDLAFDSPLVYGVGDRPALPALADLDGDSDLDLAVPGRFSDDVTVLLNAGDGRFTASARWRTDPGPTAIAALELDGDSLPDLAITSAIADCVTLWRNTTPVGTTWSSTAPCAAEIVYELEAPARVKLVVFNSSGRLVRTLIDGFVPESGRHDIAWDGTDDAGDTLPHGTYFYRVATERSIELKRTTLF